MVLCLVKQVDQRLDHPLLRLGGQRGFERVRVITCPHEVLVRAEVRERDGSVLDCVLLETPLNSFEQEGSDLLLDELVPEDFVETQVGEVAAALAVVLHIFCVFEHVYHEVDDVLGGDLLVAV